MTTISVVSTGGAPGATSIALVLAANWPDGRRVVIVEDDPSGGDLAVRFGGTGTVGWTSLRAALRRSADRVDVAQHLQRLTGGVEVLAGTFVHGIASTGGAAASGDVDAVLAWARDPRSTVDLVVDLGRLVPMTPSQAAWLQRSDAVVAVCRNELAALVHARNVVASWDLTNTTAGPHVHLVVAGSAPYRRDEAASFLGADLAMMVDDRALRAVSTGRHRRGDVRARRRLAGAAGTLVRSICEVPEDPGVPQADRSSRPDPSSSVERSASPGTCAAVSIRAVAR